MFKKALSSIKGGGKTLKTHTLEFERPLVNLLGQINELESTTSGECNDIIDRLKKEFNDLKDRIYSNLEPAQRIQIARHPDRPYTLDIVKGMGENWIELHGDRCGNDDGAIVGGLLQVREDLVVMVVGNEKGRGIKEKQKRNFGMPQPSGYAKALRLFKHAERFNLPIITFIDTPGAYPGLEAEANGQSRAIAYNIQEMFDLTVPIISIITGEGGSGGALAIAVANRVMMLEHSVYSVISPEGCAAILWRTRDKSAVAAKALKITAGELIRLGLIDEIIPEPPGGAHEDPQETINGIKKSILSSLDTLTKLPKEELKKQRLDKFRSFGEFLE
jgi:acetyl-CoA carboxylase carboxyl transferase subunit alpha